MSQQQVLVGKSTGSVEQTSLCGRCREGCKLIRIETRDIDVTERHVEDPAHNTHHKRHGGFVHFQAMFQRNAGIARNEEKNNNSSH